MPSMKAAVLSCTCVTPSFGSSTCERIILPPYNFSVYWTMCIPCVLPTLENPFNFQPIRERENFDAFETGCGGMISEKNINSKTTVFGLFYYRYLILILFSFISFYLYELDIHFPHILKVFLFCIIQVGSKADRAISRSSYMSQSRHTSMSRSGYFDTYLPLFLIQVICA